MHAWELRKPGLRKDLDQRLRDRLASTDGNTNNGFEADESVTAIIGTDFKDQSRQRLASAQKEKIARTTPCSASAGAKRLKIIGTSCPKPISLNWPISRHYTGRTAGLKI